MWRCAVVFYVVDKLRSKAATQKAGLLQMGTQQDALRQRSDNVTQRWDDTVLPPPLRLGADNPSPLKCHYMFGQCELCLISLYFADAVFK